MLVLSKNSQRAVRTLFLALLVTDLVCVDIEPVPSQVGTYIRPFFDIQFWVSRIQYSMELPARDVAKRSCSDHQALDIVVLGWTMKNSSLSDSSRGSIMFPGTISILYCETISTTRYLTRKVRIVVASGGLYA